MASNFSGKLTVTGNVLSDNWGGVVLWENSNRYCGDGSDGACTLVTASTYTMADCGAHLKGDTPTQTPDYYDNCRWKTQNVTVSGNTFTSHPLPSAPTARPLTTAASTPCSANTAQRHPGRAGRFRCTSPTTRTTISRTTPTTARGCLTGSTRATW